MKWSEFWDSLNENIYESYERVPLHTWGLVHMGALPSVTLKVGP